MKPAPKPAVETQVQEQPAEPRVHLKDARLVGRTYGTFKNGNILTIYGIVKAKERRTNGVTVWLDVYRSKLKTKVRGRTTVNQLFGRIIGTLLDFLRLKKKLS